MCTNCMCTILLTGLVKKLEYHAAQEKEQDEGEEEATGRWRSLQDSITVLASCNDHRRSHA